MIRRIEPKDVDETLRVFRDACTASHPFLKPEFIEATERKMRERTLFEFHTDVLDEGGIRALLCRNGWGVEALFVDPHFQSQGLGKRMLDHLKAQTNVVQLCVFAQNPRAIRFYQREEFYALKIIDHRETGESLVVLKWEGKNPVVTS
ncbi:GNAT family N-acetyltransferase [Usitatibacter palustris]|uniref:N-acetyltransferase domain-containing protein n=1 Tax=Usitatibacter palustris TaxID=2732487 RepID=A0A6M4H3B1_9PROT|nr:GNAT family N-acetyltransferase [Usitatibacter palustris]QJR13568.1 hypothetical protein DSM104440_00352 [Usitatibacter palustris]